MRFDPKWMPADLNSPLDGTAELPDDLPEDLALLGCALSDDAERLAERYPAQHDSIAPIASAAAQRWRIIAGTTSATTTAATATAAALALVAASIALLIYAGGIPFRQPGATLADQGPARGMVHNASDAADVLQLVPSVWTDNLPPLRGAFFRELSGPQQEAVLDLLEENALAQSSVSI